MLLEKVHGSVQHLNPRSVSVGVRARKRAGGLQGGHPGLGLRNPDLLQ